jgi:ATP-dependent protease HslVU (ClpYQ) peptidase subunit
VTCIVAVSDGKRVIIGGDSAGVSGWDMTVRADEKVFRVGHMVMGFTSSFRMGQLLRYKLHVPDHPDGMEDHRYLATHFIDAVRQCMRDGGYAKTESGREEGGIFLVGYRGSVWKIDSDFQVGRSVAGFDAVGCGADYALGAMAAMRGRPTVRVLRALEIAAQFSAGVRGPFTTEFA